jgi:hypothetical protein
MVQALQGRGGWGSMERLMGLGIGYVIKLSYIRGMMPIQINLSLLEGEFSVCKVEDYSQTDVSRPFVFTASTDEEYSLVCPSGLVPGNTVARNDGWRAFRIEGILDFSLTGILSRISSVLAENSIGIFAVSSFNTDYILVRTSDLDKAVHVLSHAGYNIK